MLDLEDIVVYTRDKKHVKGLKSKTVLSVARQHYNCPYIRSVDLENEGGEGSMGAHWERNILLNEMMTASEITNARISEFTLALMEDSGWYYTNFDFKEHFTHWKNVGCLLNFDLDLERMSLDGIKIDQLYYANNECQVKHSKGCYYDFTHQALCYKDEFMGNPNDERYA